MTAGDDEAGPGMSLVVPFIACRSQGGPYEDESFVAGFQAGEIMQTLAVGTVFNVDTFRWPIFRMALHAQVDLIAMHHGYVTNATADERLPEWGALTVSRADQ